jgi:hypothetical protein
LFSVAVQVDAAALTELPIEIELLHWWEGTWEDQADGKECK